MSQDRVRTDQEGLNSKTFQGHISGNSRTEKKALEISKKRR